GECTGANRAFYFGFPNQLYIDGARSVIDALSGIEIPTGTVWSENRMFNCLYCPHGIDSVRSAPPFVAVCR
ncbi:MAG: hypothetical protein FWC83_02390, partial [Alphaproteobacteria bacterium]|nr:hypothetical protein [Alphaproteobacteria bacterium]